MNAATEFDVGPLTWVKSEIDLAIERAASALQQFTENGDRTQLRFARTHLHQVQGALAIVGLDGVTQFAEALEGLFEHGETAPELPAGLAETGQRALAAIRHYLDDLVAGEPNQPLRLLPEYREVLAARGIARVSPTDLFYPDLSHRPPRAARPAPALSPDELKRVLRQQRARFQRGLLNWLRAPATGDGAAEMRSAVQQIENTQTLPAARAFWWIAGAFLEALQANALPAEVNVKQLCARIDLQIRRLLEGSRNVAERLMRDALYFVASAPLATPLIDQVRTTYQLASAMPAPAPASSANAAQESARRRLREGIVAAEEAWNKFCAGAPGALPGFRDLANQLHQGSEPLGHTDFRRLAQAIAATANWLAEKPARHSEMVAMELATALLLAQNAIDNFTHLGGDFAHQVDVMVARLHGCIAETPPDSSAEVPLLDEMSRRAQERLLIGQVAREIQTNLAQIEQVLDGFFRDADRRGDLGALEAPLRQAIGALTIMNQPAAVAALQECAAEIRRFGAPDYQPNPTDFERVADRFSELGFFIDSMQHGASDFEAFSRTLREPAAPVEDEIEEEAPGTVEQALAETRRETQNLLEAYKSQPEDPRLREELRQNLQTLQQDADLVDDAALGRQAKAALSALDAPGSEPARIDDAIATILPRAPEAPAPSAQTLQLAEASEEELDAELLAIFIEEAKEVQDTIGSQLGQLRAHPHNVDSLTTIRRSFHTLKGSGRMVGLRDLGEVAWEMEQTLNLWLRQELTVSPPLIELIETAHPLFTQWVRALETHECPIPDAAPLVAAAARLRRAAEGGDEAAPDAPPSGVAASAAAAPAPETAIPAGEVPAMEVPAMEFAVVEAPVGAPPVDRMAPETEAGAEFGVETVVLPDPFEPPPPPPASEEHFDFDFSLDDLLGNAAAAAPESPVEPEPAETPVLPSPPPVADEVATAGSEAPSRLTGDAPAGESAPPAPVLVQPEPGMAEAPAPGDALPEAAAPAALPEEPPPVPEMPSTPPVTGGSGPEDFSFDVTLDGIPAEQLVAAPAPVEAAPAATGPGPADFAPAEEPPAVDDGIPRLSISPTLFQIFLEEARNHLKTLHASLDSLTLDPAQATPYPMTRAAHTLAGIAGTVGLADVNRFALALEHALLRRDASARPGSVEALEVLRQALAALTAMVDEVAEQRIPAPEPRLTDELGYLYPPAPLPGGDPLPAPGLPVEADELAQMADEMSFDLDGEPGAATPAGDAGVPAETPVEDLLAEAVLSGVVDVRESPAALPPELPRLVDELDEQLLPIFLEEADELSGEITHQLRLWREAPGNAEIPRALHRLLHTLKGSARMAGAMNLGEITHAIESRVEESHRKGTGSVELIDEVESTFDTVAQIIERLRRGEPLDLPAPPPAAPAPAEAATPLQPAAAPATVQPSAPPVAATIGQAQPEPQPDEAHAQHAHLRVRADLIDRLVNEAGELSIARARIEGEMRSLKDSLLDLTENVIRLRRQLREVEIQAESQIQSRIAQAEERHAGFDPLEFDRFTRFQELTRMMAESVNDVATVQQNLLRNLDDANAAILAQARMNRELQQELMSVRMVPFASHADRLYRIVRQTAKELGKRANLEIRGGQVEIDRSVLDSISAPLEHMLRNAVAHGLEDRETRLAAGKAEMGDISLTLAQEGNEIIISMVDDGRGIDLARVRERAIEAGLLRREDPATDAQLIDLIFMPGFSTAHAVSQIAGRGIGMDVVKTAITNLGGRIEVVTNPGHGSTFRLYIPLTLAVTQALLVRSGNHTYAVPSSMIEQVMELREEALARLRDAGQAEWLGNRYPYHFLSHLLGDPGAVPETHRRYWVLLLRSGTQRVAVQVDELQGNQEIVVKNIGQQLARVVGIAGATVLGDGKVVLILNPVALAARPPLIAASTVGAAAGAPAAPQPEAKAATLPTVMVVDDSLTVRKITSRLLAREGYQVLLAKDGVDALEQLIEIVPDVMLVDIEMPRMDGFDLTRNVRADERLRHVPIIMITSRTADKHRNYAYEIGVNNYLGKPYQEDELLALVAEYTAVRHGVTLG